jgi:hypothetical protein
MKVTAVVDHHGEVVASVRGHQSEFPALATLGGDKVAAQPQAYPTLIAKPGQTIHELEVPDEVGDMSDAEKFHRRVTDHLPPELQGRAKR